MSSIEVMIGLADQLIKIFTTRKIPNTTAVVNITHHIDLFKIIGIKV